MANIKGLPRMPCEENPLRRWRPLPSLQDTGSYLHLPNQGAQSDEKGYACVQSREPWTKTGPSTQGDSG